MVKDLAGVLSVAWELPHAVTKPRVGGGETLSLLRGWRLGLKTSGYLQLPVRFSLRPSPL